MGKDLPAVTGNRQALLNLPVGEYKRYETQVEQGFVQKYGPTVLAAPTMKGFDRMAYILPLVALFLGFGLVVTIVRTWKNRPAPAIAGGLRPVRGAELEQFRDQAGKETDL